MSITILFIGLMVFFAHFLSMQFRKTNIPDVLILMLVGILLGPVLGIVTPEDFGKAGSVIATIALVVILFESGTTLNLNVLGKSLGMTGLMAFTCFSLSAVIITLAGMYALELALLPAIMLGVILGGSTSAVVIPMVEALQLTEKPATILVLESALTDVLCIVGVFALLQIHTQGGFEAGRVAGGMLASLILAAVFGVIGGIGWLLVLGKVRDFPNTISSTLAYVFIIYGLTETLGYSGAIAALALGVTMVNYRKFRINRIRSLSDKDIEPLSKMDYMFYRESVFLLKTYFFIYLGISIHFSATFLMLVAIAMTALVFIMRIALIRFIYLDGTYTLRDSAITSMMVPKGLAAAVLAGMPLQFGVAGGDIIRDTTYMVVLASITLCTLLVALYPLPIIQKFYSLVLGKPVSSEKPKT